MITAINPKVLFNINEQSAYIDKTLPHEVFQLVLKCLSQKDKISSIQVSKYWQYMTLEAVRGQNNSSLMLFGERMLTIMHDKFPHLCPEFSKLTSGALIASSNLAECHELVIKRREEVINLLTSLKFDELDQLRIASWMVRKPRFFETIFDLTKLYKEFAEIPVTSDSYKDCLYNVCMLGGFDKALESAEINRYKAIFFHFIAKELCINGYPEKALAIASRTYFSYQQDIMIKLFGMGANEQGIILGDKIKVLLPDEDRNGFALLVPWLNLMQKGKFKPEDLKKQRAQRIFELYQAAIMESANNLIKERCLDEAVIQASWYENDQFNFNLAIKSIELDKWNEFPRLRMSGTVPVRIARTLYSYYKFTEAAKICVKFDLDLASTYEIYQAMQEEKFDEVMIIADRVPDYETTLDLSKKLAEKGQIEKAYTLVDKIQDYKMKHEALKFINGYL